MDLDLLLPEPPPLDIPPGSVAQGDECRGIAECAPVVGKVIDCRCTDDADVPICVADAEPGESCVITGNFQPLCRESTYCGSVGASFDDMRCMPFLGEGEDCSNGGLCAEPYYCDITRHCALGDAPLGASCALVPSQFCAQPNVCGSDDTCTEPAAVGQPCTPPFPGDRNPCVEGSMCAFPTEFNEDGPSSAVCTPLKPDGAECARGDECLSGSCSLDRCGTGSIPGNLTYGCGF